MMGPLCKSQDCNYTVLGVMRKQINKAASPCILLHSDLFLIHAGFNRSWKTWKVMKFKNFIFQAWKVKEYYLIVCHGKSWKIKVMSDRLDIAYVKVRTM